MIYTIAQHELSAFFKTGKIWKLLALCQCILGLIFYWLIQDFLFKSQKLLIEQNSSFGITEEVIHPLLAWTALFFFFITPLLATSSLTQERKSHTLELYLISPISTTDIILGKFLGSTFAQIFLLFPVLVMPLFITLHDRLDIGQFMTGLLGLVLLLTTSLSLGFFISSFSKEPLIAALVIFISLFLLSLLEWGVRFISPYISWLAELALLYHCKNFLSGVINSRDVLYYVLTTIFFLYLSVIRLNQEAIFKGNT